MERKPLIVIEHLEIELSPWILLEYRHSSILAGKDRIMYTNVPLKYHSILSRYGKVSMYSVLDIFDHKRLLILDPKADKALNRKDLENIDAVVIGGILGDHPPRGRTYTLLSSRAKDSIKRNIGDGQYSIDGAVYVVLEVLRRGCLECIDYVDGVELSKIIGDEEVRVFLPFRYPIINNKPLLAPGLSEYLLNGKLPDFIIEEINRRSSSK